MNFYLKLFFLTLFGSCFYLPEIVFAPIIKIQLQLGNVNIFETKRSSKGFGSTGLE